MTLLLTTNEATDPREDRPRHPRHHHRAKLWPDLLGSDRPIGRLAPRASTPRRWSTTSNTLVLCSDSTRRRTEIISRSPRSSTGGSPASPRMPRHAGSTTDFSKPWWRWPGIYVTATSRLSQATGTDMTGTARRTNGAVSTTDGLVARDQRSPAVSHALTSNYVNLAALPPVPPGRATPLDDRHRDESPRRSLRPAGPPHPAT